MHISRRFLTKGSAAVLLVVGGGLGCILGEWLWMVATSMAVGGNKVSGLYFRERLFLHFSDTFATAHPSLSAAIEIGGGVMALTGFSLGGVLGTRTWNHLMVDRLRWMTRDQAVEFWNKKSFRDF